MIRYDLAALIEIYKISVDEYRFTVQLGWDRTKYYLFFNIAILSAGTGLLSLGGPREVYLLTALVFILGTMTCLIGVRAIRTGHKKYYRKAVYKKTLAEEVLGLGSRLEHYPYPDATLTLATTEGQKVRSEILHETERWLGRPLRKTSVVAATIAMLYVLAIIDVGGAIFALLRWLQAKPVVDDLFVVLEGVLCGWAWRAS